jgi:UDP-glucose 4-epimerase
VLGRAAGGISSVRSVIGDRRRAAPSVPGLRAVRDA